MKKPMKYVFLPVNETCDLYWSIVQLLMHDDIQVNYTLITKVVFSVHFRKSEKSSVSKYCFQQLSDFLKKLLYLMVKCKYLALYYIYIYICIYVYMYIYILYIYISYFIFLLSYCSCCWTKFMCRANLWHPCPWLSIVHVQTVHNWSIGITSQWVKKRVYCFFQGSCQVELHVLKLD